jgi:hypothetical protein
VEPVQGKRTYSAIGVSAINNGKRVRFYNAVDLVNQLEREKQAGKTGITVQKLIQVDAVIVDLWAIYLSLSLVEPCVSLIQSAL